MPYKLFYSVSQSRTDIVSGLWASPLLAEAVEKLPNWLTSNFSDFILQRAGRVIWRLSGDMRLVDEISTFVTRSLVSTVHDVPLWAINLYPGCLFRVFQQPQPFAAYERWLGSPSQLK